MLWLPPITIYLLPFCRVSPPLTVLTPFSCHSEISHPKAPLLLIPPLFLTCLPLPCACSLLLPCFPHYLVNLLPCASIAGDDIPCATKCQLANSKSIHSTVRYCATQATRRSLWLWESRWVHGTLSAMCRIMCTVWVRGVSHTHSYIHPSLASSWQVHFGVIPNYLY